MAIDLSGAQVEAFALYAAQLLEWNRKMNLTAITEPEEVAVKHMLDSLLCFRAEVFPEGCSVIDVGTGAGFPGLPLKIWKSALQVTLLDSLQKRVRFLQEVSDALRLEDVVCLHGRAEEYGRDKRFRQRFDVAVSRAVARLSVLAEYCLPFVKPGGCFVALKGAKYREELEAAGAALSVLGGKLERVKTVVLPQVEETRALLYIRKVKDTPGAYPRKAGAPEKKPL